MINQPSKFDGFSAADQSQHSFMKDSNLKPKLSPKSSKNPFSYRNTKHASTSRNTQYSDEEKQKADRDQSRKVYLSLLNGSKKTFDVTG